MRPSTPQPDDAPQPVQGLVVQQHAVSAATAPGAAQPGQHRGKGEGQLGIDRQTMLGVIMVCCVIAFPMHALFGALSNRVGRRPVYIFGAVAAAVLAFPFFALLQSGSFWLMLLGYVLLINIAHNSINAVQPAFFTELFGPRVRYSGASIGAQLGAIAVGGFTPFIAKGLSAVDGGGWRLVAGYVVVVSLISATAAYFGPETSKRGLTDEHPV